MLNGIAKQILMCAIGLYRGCPTAFKGFKNSFDKRPTRVHNIIKMIQCFSEDHQKFEERQQCLARPFVFGFDNNPALIVLQKDFALSSPPSSEVRPRSVSDVPFVCCSKKAARVSTTLLLKGLAKKEININCCGYQEDEERSNPACSSAEIIT